jgi:hypothetical protein
VQALREEGLAMVKLVLQTGEVNELWRRAKESCEQVLVSDQQDWEIAATLGILLSLDGQSDAAKQRIQSALDASSDVRVMLAYYCKTQQRYKNAVERAGIPPESVEARLAPDERERLAKRIAQDASR